jgi:D-sedoheptulose 7-phosphate isomerase
MNNFFSNFSNKLVSLIKINKNLSEKLKLCANIFKSIKTDKKKIIFLGNGASSAISSHVSVDLTKNAKIRSVNFNESDLITCLVNDYGADEWMQEALKMYCDNGDIVVLISSSGMSKNIVKAANWCLKSKITLITFTGHKRNNSLRKINKKGLNFWVNSKAYNHIEIVHLFWLLSIVDFIIGKTIYKVAFPLK